jgi:ketosteroid isomerase-like protein
MTIRDAHEGDSTLGMIDRFTDAINAHDIDALMTFFTEDAIFESTLPPDGQRYEGREAVRGAMTELIDSNPKARFDVEEQFTDGSERAVVRWRYDWGDGHVRGVDIIRVRDGKIAETLAYVKG